MADPHPDFRATVETYSGPLDLLLYLIRKDEVDVFDIPVSRVIEQYHEHLDFLRDIDPNVSGEFLVMAARLMEVKSKLLLPREVLEDEDEEYEDPRLELVKQLLEYKKFKERALLLEKKMDSHKRRYVRPRQELDIDAEDVTEPLPLGNTDVWDLLTAFHRIQLVIAQRVPHEVMLEDRPIEDFMNEVEALLQAASAGGCLFEDLFQGARTRGEAIGYFIAVLELAKQHILTITQDELGSEIRVQRRTDEEIERLQAEDSESAEVEPAEEHLLRGEGEEALAEDRDGPSGDEAEAAEANEGGESE
jgi:segregation and condensation protein A|tara:strand:+ start:639 stop:1553 length:915 start_codon:yes stop_codon:yes gene_type:complete